MPNMPVPAAASGLPSSVHQVEGSLQFIVTLTPGDAYAIMLRARAAAEAAGMTPEEWRAASRGDGRGGAEHDISVLLGLASLHRSAAA